MDPGVVSEHELHEASEKINAMLQDMRGLDAELGMYGWEDIKKAVGPYTQGAQDAFEKWSNPRGAVSKHKERALTNSDQDKSEIENIDDIDIRDKFGVDFATMINRFQEPVDDSDFQQDMEDLAGWFKKAYLFRNLVIVDNYMQKLCRYISENSKEHNPMVFDYVESLLEAMKSYTQPKMEEYMTCLREVDGIVRNYTGQGIDHENSESAHDNEFQPHHDKEHGTKSLHHPHFKTEQSGGQFQERGASPASSHSKPERPSDFSQEAKKGYVPKTHYPIGKRGPPGAEASGRHVMPSRSSSEGKEGSEPFRV